MYLRVTILVLFIALLALPFAFRTRHQEPIVLSDRPQVIIVTPHNEQIRYEFGRGFERWYKRKFNQDVQVVYNVPGGTSEIRKMLESQTRAALEGGTPVGGSADLVFGGGSSEFKRLKNPITVSAGGETRTASILAPVDFDQAWLESVYGQNQIGDTVLYDQEKYWFGTALSGFGIVWNRDMLRQLGVGDPVHWADLAHPKLVGHVALVNPAQSGSIATAFEAILKQKGWTKGWQILRRAGANARYFSGSSLKPPIDVTQGDAAMGVCIDFYGRYQSQMVRMVGDSDRVGYIDPPGETTIDPDPIAMLNGAPHPELAKRFIEFCLSVDGQSLWQFPAGGNTNDGLGPEKFELRRLPIVREMYDRYADRFIDHAEPFKTSLPTRYPDAPFREFVSPIFASMVMDCQGDLREAWQAIIHHPAYPVQGESSQIVTAADVTDPSLKSMLELFDSMPGIPGIETAADSSGQERVFSLNPEAYEREGISQEQATVAFFDVLKSVRAGWLKGEWSGKGLWSPEASGADELRRRCTREFTKNYREIVRIANESAAAVSMR
ncbi:MAG TPA: extracellular solute-binding protein [Phycisphaerales bacterium]|nr:extracellular solute-binding protein [Phycisphaerales bacterium]